MTTIAASRVQELRSLTNCPMMDCRNALVDSGGDFEGAKKLLRERLGSLDTSKPDSGKEGLIVANLSIDNHNAAYVIMEIGTETDFASNNPQVIEMCADSVSMSPKHTTEETIHKLRSITGENIILRRAESKNLNAKDGAIYIHHNRKSAALIFFSGVVDDEIKKNIAMHIVAANPAPVCIKPEDIPESVLASEKSYLEDKAIKSGKPPAIQEKIVNGGLNKFKNSLSLLEQDFVKDSSKKVKDILPNGIEIIHFVRWEIE